MLRSAPDPTSQGSAFARSQLMRHAHLVREDILLPWNTKLKTGGDGPPGRRFKFNNENSAFNIQQ